jgi:predicted dehydrogenase
VTFKVAVFGTGKVARDNYLPLLREQADVELGLYNRTTRIAQDEARVGGRAFETLDEALDWGPDIAFVLTSERVRADVASLIIRAGVPRVFVEKPLTAAAGQALVSEQDYEVGKTLVSTAGAAGTEMAINFNYRFFLTVQQVMAAVAERSWGSLISFAGRVHFACWSHLLDLVGLFGGAAVRVSALEGPVVRSARGMESRDLAVTLLTASGATGVMTGSVSGPWQHSLYDLILDFEGGRAVLRDLDAVVELHDRDSEESEVRSLVADRSRWNRYASSFRASIEAYLETVRRGSPPLVPVEAGLQELRLEAAIRRSVRIRREVDIDKEFPR